ncbi:MAG: RNA polymerase sigma factor [Pseudomonadota bacterium]
MTVKEEVGRAVLLELLPRLKRFCLALTGREHDADDLLQMTVERLLSKGAPADADLTKWSFRVCKNIWIDEVRARKVRSATSIDDAPEVNPVDGERTAVAHLSLNQVRSALKDLPEEQRMAISLVALEGFSYQEAAEIMGSPIGTVMSRLSRARAALAAVFDEAVPSH